MSSRQLRKLQQQRQQAKLQAQQEEEEEEFEDEPTIPTASKASLFANLAALEDENEDADEEPEKEEVGDDDLSEHDPAPTSTAKKPKKPKKKKKKKAAKTKDDSAEKAENKTSTDDIDAALRELNLKQSSGGGSVEQTIVKVDPEYQRVCALLGITSQHLKVANEMRNLFGKGITDIHRDDEDPAGRGGRRGQHGQNQQLDLEAVLKGKHPKGRGLPELTLRRNTFIQGKDDWPKSSTGGLRMEIVDDKAHDGTIEFKYAYDKDYTAVQQGFRQAVEIGDPEQMITRLQANPYNVSLLLIVSKIAKNQGDHALSADLVERALFTFGRAATTLFNSKMTQGKARLDFARPENRELWLAGYQYIKALLMKGTYRTALEWAKFLLALDPEGDPYCMRLLIHNFAIRGHEFQYLLDLYESQLPELWSESNTSSLTHTFPSLAYAAIQLKESTKCRELLSKSMQQTPWLFNRLFQEINLDSPPSIWGIMPRTDAETLFTEMYVLQTKDLWNTPAATALLMEIAHTIPKVNEKSIPKLENSEMTLDVVRYVYVDDNPSIMKYAPSHLLHQRNNSDYDPLPPTNNIYSSYSVRVQGDGEDHQRGFGLGEDLNNPLDGILAFINRNGPALAQRGINADDLRRAIAEDGSEESDDDDDEVHQQPNGERSITRRLLDMFWLGARAAPVEESEEEEEDEWEDEDENEEMPGLIDETGRLVVAAGTESVGEDEDGTDDEMPGLVQAP